MSVKPAQVIGQLHSLRYASMRPSAFAMAQCRTGMHGISVDGGGRRRGRPSPFLSPVAARRRLHTVINRAQSYVGRANIIDAPRPLSLAHLSPCLAVLTRWGRRHRCARAAMLQNASRAPVQEMGSEANLVARALTTALSTIERRS